MPASSFTERFGNDEVLKRVLDSVSDYAIFTLDPNGIVTTWNDGARNIKGWEADEIIGRHFRVLYIPKDREEGHPEHNLRLALENGEYREERVRQRKDGTHFEADVDISPIFDEEGVHAGFLKVVRDISEKKRLEEELRAGRDELEMKVLQRTTQLRHANQELEAFCYSIAHDLRAPIRGIIGRCRIAEEDLGESLPHEMIEHLDGVAETARRLADLVDDLLEFARLGQKPISRQPVNLSALARRLSDEIGPTCQSGSATIKVEEELWAEADPKLLELLLHNLLENACKYSSRDVRIYVGRTKIGGEEVFYVKDDGIGFDMAYASKLFLPFERLHRNNDIEGTGIGLANVKRIVVRHGGRIWADSTPGVGATFFFTLEGDDPRPYDPLPHSAVVHPNGTLKAERTESVRASAP